MNAPGVSHTPGRNLRRASWLLCLGAALLLALSACGSSEPEAPKPDPATVQREAEARAQREAAARRAAEQRRLAEERRRQEELLSQFGDVGEPPVLAESPPKAGEARPTGAADPGTAAGVAAGGPAPGARAPATIPFDEAVPALPAEPMVRVAVLGYGADSPRARQVALIIGTYERGSLEERLGAAVRIAYVAQLKHPPQRASEVRYRPEFLRAAQSVARVLPAEQWIGPMTEDEARQDSVDVLVYVSERYR